MGEALQVSEQVPTVLQRGLYLALQIPLGLYANHQQMLWVQLAFSMCYDSIC